jgi:hypothetical protein
MKQRPSTQVRPVSFDFQEGEYRRLGARDLSANRPLCDLEHARGFVVGNQERAGGDRTLEHRAD